MEQKAPDEKTLRKVLSEIIKGHSCLDHEGSLIYTKHFNQEDQASLDEHYQTVFDKAKKQGLPTEEETMELLRKEDLLTKVDESSYETQKKYIENLRDTKKNLIIPSQIENIEKDIREAEEEYNKLHSKKLSLLTQTCESYAKKKNNDYSLYLSFYRDPECQQKYFSEEDFSFLSKEELNELLLKYVDCTKHLSIDNIKYLAINNIFNMYYNLLGKESIYTFFNKPLYSHSYYQLNLLNYAKILNSIIEHSDKMPDSVKEHPDRIFDFAEAQKKNKDVISRTQNKQGASVVGATKKDMKDMGVSDELSVSPFDLAKKKGSLTIEDFQNFS